MKEKKVKKVGSFFNYIGKLFSSALLILLLLIGGFLVYYLVSAKMVSKNPTYEPKINLYTIVSGSMEPTIKVYDVIIDFRVKNPEDIKVGDVITFKSTSNISRGLIVTHRVIDVKVVNGRYEYVTKGDYNPTSDTDTAKFDNIIGKVVLKLPQLGRVQFFLSSKIGWFLVVLLPATCVIIYDIIKLIRLLLIKKSSDEVKGLSDNKKVDVSDEDIDIKDVLNKINKKTKLKDLENLKDHNKNEG